MGGITRSEEEGLPTIREAPQRVSRRAGSPACLTRHRRCGTHAAFLVSARGSRRRARWGWGWKRTRSRPRRRALLALSRTVGTHPEPGKPILAGIGRHGPWLKHGAAYVALPEDEDVLAVGLNRAVALVDTA